MDIEFLKDGPDLAVHIVRDGAWFFSRFKFFTSWVMVATINDHFPGVQLLSIFTDSS